MTCDLCKKQDATRRVDWRDVCDDCGWCLENLGGGFFVSLAQAIKAEAGTDEPKPDA